MKGATADPWLKIRIKPIRRSTMTIGISHQSFLSHKKFKKSFMIFERLFKFLKN